MASAGDEVHVISYALPPRLAGTGDRVRFHEVEVRAYPLFEYPPYSLALATKMVEVARRHHLDVLHVHYAVPNAVSAILARQILAPQVLPVVTTLHGTDVTLVGTDPSYLATTRFGVLESDAVTAVSEWLRTVTLEQLSIEREISVIPNFVDASRFAATASTTVSTGAHAAGGEAVPVLVHVSNFREIKRPFDVVEVFRQVSLRRPCRLLLVGDGPELQPVEQRLIELGLRSRVDLVGQVDAIEQQLTSADVFLLTSEQESFGLAALEALAAGVPVIASRAGGLPEVVEDGRTGLLYEVGDTAGMAAGVLELLADPERRRRLGDAGREVAFAKYSRERAVERYRQVYLEVIGARPSRARAARPS